MFVFSPYPRYRREGHFSVPSNWQTGRLKDACRFAYGDAMPAEARDDGAIVVMGSNGPIGTHSRANTVGKTIIIGRKGSHGKVNVSLAPVWVMDTAYFVDERTSTANLDWLSHVLLWLALDQQSRDSAVPGLDRHDAMIRVIPIPPRGEQVAIAKYLRHAHARIDRAIAAKRKLIALLEEQKQALHAEIIQSADGARIRLKDVAAVQAGLTLGKDYSDQSVLRYLYLRVANVQMGHVDITDLADVEVPANVAARSMLRAGDVLMTEGGDLDKLGRGTVWDGSVETCLHQNHVFAVRCRDRLLPEFLAQWLVSPSARYYFHVTAKKTTNLAATNSTTVREMPLVLPCGDEQRRLLARISQQSHPIARAVLTAWREIELLQEFRARLTSDVVTGQVDVREIAATLPELTDEAIAATESEFGDDESIESELELVGADD